MPKSKTKTSPTPQSPAAPDANLPFEEAIERLETIVERMESERAPLDQLISDYEEGTTLLKLCRQRIDNARERVETINKDLASASDQSTNDEAPDEPTTDDDSPLL